MKIVCDFRLFSHHCIGQWITDAVTANRCDPPQPPNKACTVMGHFQELDLAKSDREFTEVD